jgi:hypothetical protein
MEESNEYNTIQNEEPTIYINDEIEVDQLMEERENPSFQIEISSLSKSILRN